MLSRKKLQVFVSSTYTDLRQERQAAVEAILTAGHIPAGMELFAAGDQSQMDVIKRWIDESDVFLLILGGRYGSLEPTSKKSYVELEYEYAHDKGKPSFAVVIKEDHLEEKVKAHGISVIETESSQQLKLFRQTVLSRISKFWGDPRDIKLAVLETLSEFGRREELVGWIPGNQSIDAGPLAEEIARLAKENASLRERLSKAIGVTATFSGLAFEDMYQMLRDELIDLRTVEEDFGNEAVSELEACVATFEDSKPSLLHLLWLYRDGLASELGFRNQEELFDRLRGFGLVEMKRQTMALAFTTGLTPETPAVTYGLTHDGRQFLLRLRLELSRQAGAGKKSLGDAGIS